MVRGSRSWTAWAAALLLGLWACGGDEHPAGQETAAGGGDAAKGAAIYGNICITCHGPDPTVPGPVGPAIAGSSEALLAAKVLRGEYPPGYTPKRGASKAMPPLPYLKDNIADLAAFLQATGG